MAPNGVLDAVVVHLPQCEVCCGIPLTSPFKNSDCTNQTEMHEDCDAIKFHFLIATLAVLICVFAN